MLKKIKSEFFINFLFAFLDEEIKLKSVRYNKKFQEIIDINIMNYKLFSRRNIFYKEKDNDEIYDSENLNKIEDDYLKMPKNGKGEEYYYDGQLRFEGEYKDGKKNGKGKE